MEELSTVQLLAIAILPIVFAITGHEASHAWVAWKLGDNTARLQGRVSFNPIRHIDLIGTIILPSVLMYLGGILFGWAKPVPVDWRNFRRPRRDMGLVALAGPVSNLLMAVFWLLLAKLAISLGLTEGNGRFVFLTGLIGAWINLMFCVLNLLPILPLDGGRVLHSLLPQPLANLYGRLEPAGLLILLLLLFTGLLGSLLGPVMDKLLELLWLLARL